jgi:hypothetical protein
MKAILNKCTTVVTLYISLFEGWYMARYSEYIPSLSRVCPEYIPSLYRTRVKLRMNLGRTGVNVIEAYPIADKLLVNAYPLTCHSDEGGI